MWHGKKLGFGLFDWSDWTFARLVAEVVTTTYITLTFNNIQNGVILVPSKPGPPGKWPLNGKRDVIVEFFSVDD